MKILQFKTPQFWLLVGGLLLAALGTWIWWASPRPAPVDIFANQTIASLRPVQASSGGAEIDYSGAAPVGGAADRGTPQAELPLSFFDFGRIRPTDVVQHRFLVANRGEGSLLIQRVYTTCGCTVADLSSVEIPPGQASLITITFDAGFHDVSGTTVRRGLIMETNDPLAPTLEIWVQAAVTDG